MLPLKGYCSCIKLFNTLAIPHASIPKIHRVSKHIFKKLDEYCIALPKPIRDALLSLGYIIKAMG
jgi:hypothetical protein